MEQYQFRIAHREDLPTIIEIFNQSVVAGDINDETKPVSSDDRQAWFNQFDRRHPIWVVVDQWQQIIGWVSLEQFYDHPAYDHSAEISIYLDQKHQGQGIGQLMIEYVDQRIEQSLDLKTVIAYIYERNQASQHLFAKCGYEHCGTLPQIAYLNGEFRSLEIYCKHY